MADDGNDEPIHVVVEDGGEVALPPPDEPREDGDH
jgi:hypothetical protein